MNFATLDRLPAQWRSRILLPILATLYAAGAFCLIWNLTLGTERIGNLGLVISSGLAAHFVAQSVWILQTGLGIAILGELGWTAPLRRMSELLVFGWICGFVLLSGVWMGLAGLGVLTAGALTATFVLAAALATWRLLRGPAREAWITMIARSSDASQSEPLPAGLVWGSGLGLLALGAFLSWPLLVQTLLPNSDWDSALYHLPLAERYLAGTLWSSDPLFSAHSFPGAISLVYAAFIGVGFESAIIPYNFLGVLVTLVAVAAMAARLADARAARWGVVVCATTHIVWQLGVDPRVDAFLCIFVMGAVLALTIFAEDRTQSTPLFLIAISLNAAMGSKYTGLFIGFAVVGVTAVAIVGEHLRRGRGPAASAIALALLLLVVPNGAWYASNLALHGDPLFPMLRGDYYESPERPDERIPTKGALAPRIDASATDSEQRRFIDSLQQTYQTETSPRHLFDLYDMHRNPDAYAVKPNHFGSPLLLLFLALPIALGRDSRKRAGGLTVYLLALGCYLALGSQANLLRYVLPILPIFAAGSGVVIARFPNRVWQAACLGLVLVLLVQHRAAETAKLENLHPGTWVETRLDRVEWLKHAGYNFTTAMPFAIERINHDIETGRMREDAVVMMIGEGKGRLLDRPTLPDLSWFLQRWTIELILADGSHERVAESLRGQGVTHVLYNRGYYDWVLRKTRTPIDEVAFAMFELERFLGDHATLVFRIKGIRLYELDTTAR